MGIMRNGGVDTPLQLSDVGLQQAEDTLPALVNDLQQKVSISSLLINVSRYAVKLDK
jgi:hypothetical protein